MHTRIFSAEESKSSAKCLSSQGIAEDRNEVLRSYTVYAIYK